MILRGGDQGPNYDEESVQKILKLQKKAKINIGIVIDASHANSGKDPSKQPEVVYDIVNQRLKGNTKIVGVMVDAWTSVAGLSIMMPIFRRPMNVMNKPMPTEMPEIREGGMASTSFFLRPTAVSIKKNRPDKKTTPRAVGQLTLSVMTRL